MPLLKNMSRKTAAGFSLFTGVFRADYYKHISSAVRWLSWIVPQSKEPDFHIPSAFGVFVFDTKK
jgi:hypothetical protein